MNLQYKQSASRLCSRILEPSHVALCRARFFEPCGSILASTGDVPVPPSAGGNRFFSQRMKLAKALGWMRGPFARIRGSGHIQGFARWDYRLIPESGDKTLRNPQVASFEPSRMGALFHAQFSGSGVVSELATNFHLDNEPVAQRARCQTRPAYNPGGAGALMRQLRPCGHVIGLDCRRPRVRFPHTSTFARCSGEPLRAFHAVKVAHEQDSGACIQSCETVNALSLELGVITRQGSR